MPVMITPIAFFSRASRAADRTARRRWADADRREDVLDFYIVSGPRTLQERVPVPWGFQNTPPYDAIVVFGFP
jgi:hypothetical protein